MDELASEYRAEVAALTESAMVGEVALEEVYGRRLDLIQPGARDVRHVGQRYIEERVPGVEDAIAALHENSVDVRVISGGLLPAVIHLTRFLGIPDDRVAAVDVAFDRRGRYLGFDSESPLARAGGKAEVLRRWRPVTQGPWMLVGDGATDLEARDEVDLFVAFAAIVRRPAVIAGADLVIEEPSFQRIVDVALHHTPMAPPRRTEI